MINPLETRDAPVRLNETAVRYERCVFALGFWNKMFSIRWRYYPRNVAITFNYSTPRRIKMHCKTRQPSLFKGIIFAMLSGASFSIVSLTVKQMKNLHPSQLTLYQFIATLLFTLPETIKTGQNPFGPPEFRFLLVLRGVLGSFFIFFSFISFQYLGLGEASVIIFSSPVFVTIFARVFLKEPCSISQSITVVLTIVGIIFTTKLPSRLTEISVAYSSEQLYGLLAVILSLFSVTALYLVTRMVRSVHHSIVMFNFNWVGILIIAFPTAILGHFKSQYCGIQSLYILLLGMFTYSGAILMVMAFQCEYAGPVTTVRAAADIILAFLWQIVIFHDVPDIYGIIGASLVLISIFLISLDKWLTTSKGSLFSCGKFN